MSAQLNQPYAGSQVPTAGLVAGEALRLASDKKIFTCVRCGSLMEERHCKVLCWNCGYFMDCSDLF